MQIMRKMKILSASIISALLLTGCLSSVRTKTVRKEGMTNEQKGKDILEKAWKQQGMDSLLTHKVYQVKGVDTWKGLLGKTGKLWPNAEAEIDLKYRIGSFDGRVEFLDGKRKGVIAGLQSWKYYEQEVNDTIVFKKKANPRVKFGLAAFQYFFELNDRLRNAPLITYAGETEFRGQQYHQVFVTWNKLKTHKENDQYNLWINKETNVLEFCEFTIHDSFLPGGSLIGGSIEFANFKRVNGINIPFTQFVYVGKPKVDSNKFLHRLTVNSFEFDSFDEEVLSPNKTLQKIGDSK